MGCYGLELEEMARRLDARMTVIAAALQALNVELRELSEALAQLLEECSKLKTAKASGEKKESGGGVEAR